ncbi:MAG: division/cell wall cluster transcriptional repressor MraZ [Ruminococcus sp.]|uniref:division/cell wall cluster transcriptional repressor MraZ n=1 Tax=Ruminococcus sp. TaxID=41978 RepID=UPI001B561B2B|nr:division/cell wall cluster transcriptional repressor MraZ [Ruminococcus sp.]MBO4493796.1 division/cell wall cluster transcriptional repressor MraZ [Ruminococcus sp.]MBP5432436.1 division/cell wall cluster transcriptional repressor MraZ [Ruminococcus sp.]
MAEHLCGTYYPSIDQKGRMSFPTKLREILGAEFFLCQGHDDAYIAVYSPEAFQDYCDKLYSITGKKGADIRRKLLAGADKQIPDKQGRIFITQQLRDHAGITDEVVVIGANNRAEIWNKSKWEEFNSSVTQEEINEALEDLVI